MLPKRFSAYLDVLRFSCAMIVFIGHAAGINWTGGFLWQFGMFADTCVIIFFVLSGFVIAYITETKENEWMTFTASRLSRLWSVIIPALALTFVIDSIGIKVAPEIYIDQPWYAGDHLLLRYIASLLMLQEVWHLKLVPGINAPFWSLSFEGIYYLAFGIFLFVRSRVKWLLLFILMIIAGPLIIALAPIWAAGALLYKLLKRASVSKDKSWAMFIVGLVGLAISPLIRSSSIGSLTILGETVLPRYLDAIFCCINIAGAYGLANHYGDMSESVFRFIAKAASITFPLYLFHRPLIQFFSYATSSDPSSLTRRALVIAGTLLVVYFLTGHTEKLRAFLRRKIIRTLSLISCPLMGRI